MNSKDGTQEARYYLGGIGNVNLITGEWELYPGGLMQIRNQKHSYILRDHLTNTRALIGQTDACGLGVFSAYDYYPYGKILRKFESTTSRYKSTDHEKDIETGYDDRNARLYDDESFQFLQTDPLAEKYFSWSPYHYVGRNPISIIDPTGMNWYKNEEGDTKWFDNTSEGFSDDNRTSWTNIGTELAEFDGKKMKYSWQERTDDGSIMGKLTVKSKEYSAVSGRAETTPDGKYQFNFTDDRQKMKATGPLPEGLYFLEKSKLQLWDNVPLWNQLYSSTGAGGQWKGGEYAWGRHRFWLTPESGNQYGRSGFTIHGGDKWGSAGCIDVGSGMRQFTLDAMSHNQEKLYINVRYNISMLIIESLNTNRKW